MNTADQPLLEAILDSWDRNNVILLNLLAALPSKTIIMKPMESSPSVAQLFTHIHYVRLVFVSEDVPELTVEVPEQEWHSEHDPAQIETMLKQSAIAVRTAVQSRITSGRAMDVHFDHPILMLQHMIWHEGYHHGQIKLALKLAGCPMSNQIAGPLTWQVWMRKT